MKNRFRLFLRGEIYYCEDAETGQQRSLQTRDDEEASKLVQAKNEAVSRPEFNEHMAKTYLAMIDPLLLTRTWADVMARFENRKNPATKTRHERVVKSPPMVFLKPKLLYRTTADDFHHAISI